ncbi:MAG TPA: hypothetical protein VFE50_24535 [Cyclobacteriaceae bacterium]|nr:hypothetical protein [Cyclobacteriaceae bacterium]
MLSPTPKQELNYNDTLKFTFNNTITVFDQNGPITSIPGPTHFKIQFWCENDGGIQHRPTTELTIQKSKTQRKLKPIAAIQNIACFAITNLSTQKLTPVNPTQSKDVVLTGDINNDSNPDCLLSTYPDDAQNCDSHPNNNLGILLHSANNTCYLRCCGP